MKDELLVKIADWNDKMKLYQNKKTDLHKELLFVDVKINELMIKYDRLCKKLLSK